MNLKEQWDEYHALRKMTEIQEDIARIASIFRKQGTKKVLDLACGAGKHLVYLAKQGFEVYGLDISAQGVKMSKTQSTTSQQADEV